MESSTQWLPAPPPATEPPVPLGYEPAPELAAWPEADDERPRPNSWLKRKLGATGAALAALIAKIKLILLALPQLKLLITFGSMFVSVAAYSLLFGWTFALGLVLLIFIHEMGHVIQLRREGVKASAPMFVPFIGAVITSRSLGDNALAEARVGLAGPILGSIGALVPLIIYHITGNELWRALAFFGFYLNLFNLIPLSPLDGGRAMAAMAPWMWVIGFAALAAVAIVFQAPIMILFLIIGGADSWRRWKARRAGDPELETYYRVSPRNRLAVAAVYIGLAALLVVGLHGTYVFRPL
ncbi:MAG TPA: site-2 protease family protein [Solirubrobacteraceae bacterium]|nr:site-2 protease family protein [Solirubrobacteraceae bacterium]